jgi:hypothetical protein
MYLHEHLARMQDEIESTTRKLELEKRRLYKLEKDLERTREEHDEKVLKSNKFTMPRKAGDASDRPVSPLSVKELEHRLGKAVITLNTYNHENKDIRDKIDSIRRERLQMNQVFKNMQVAIKENQREIAQLQTETVESTREQEDVQHHMSAKKKLMDVGRREFQNVQEWREKMNKQDRKDRIMRTVAIKGDTNQIAAAKSQEEPPKIGMIVTVTTDLEKYEKECRASGVSRRKRPPLGQKGKIEKVDFSDSTICLTNSIWVPIRALEGFEELRPQENFNAPLVMRRILKLAFLNAIQRRHLKQQMKNSEVFEQAFATIKSSTGIAQVDEIVKIFIGLEQRNFSLLTYVNVLNGQIETFEKNNCQLEETLQTKKRTDEEGEQKRTHALKDLMQQIESTSKATEENRRQTRDQDEILERCKPLIRDILEKIVVDGSSCIDSGEDEGAKETAKGFGGHPAPELAGGNVLAFLTHIEKTLTEWQDFIPEAHARHAKSNKGNYRYTIGNQVLQLQPKNFERKGGHHVTLLVKQGELPSAAANKEDDSSDDDDDLANHPWDWKELREKAIGAVAKRRRHRKIEAPSGPQATEQSRNEAAEASPGAGALAAEPSGDVAHEGFLPQVDQDAGRRHGPAAYPRNVERGVGSYADVGRRR